MLRFGTDGVRGDADTELTSASIVALGRAVARVLRPSRVLVGRDTRASGVRIEHELAVGLEIEDAAAVRLGVLPTPAIAFCAARERVPAAVVSASHNPWTDNGVKVLGADGRKLPDATEGAIERALAEIGGVAAHTYGNLGPDFTAEPEHAAAYVEHLIAALDGRTLEGLRVVLDCANGAAFDVGPHAFRRAGAEVSVLHASPDGRNINAGCGSTHPDELRAAVRAGGAAVGLAFDGDGDRVIAVDERGELVDGDAIMTMMALDLAARDALPGGAIAVTVMSNLGLRRALTSAGLAVVETPVGDRHVVEAMQRHGLVLGGEQSGHVVFAQHATTGDGVLTGLLVCDLVSRSGWPLSALAAQITRVPQVLVNVRVARGRDRGPAAALDDAVRSAEDELGERGRVLVRPSGTEPLVRIMVEADEPALAAAIAERIRRVVESEFGPA